jgi:pilus assembly protein CpaE
MNSKILVVDRSESLANSVRHAVGILRSGSDVVSCSRVGEVADVVAQEGPFDVLVAGPALMTRAGLARIAAVHDNDPGLAVVLVSPRSPEVHLKDVVRAGAVDLVSSPVHAGDLVDAIERALEHSRLLGLPTAASHVSAPAQRLGMTFTVSSATGGCGKTFYATNLAYFLSHHTGKRVVIADFDLQFGEVTTALRLRPKYTSFDLVQHPTDGELEAHIEEYLVPHETGVWVLAAPKDPSEADRFGTTDVLRILEALQKRFDYVIVDTPAQLSEIVLAAFDKSDVLFTMATLDLPSVRNMGVFLSTLQRLRIPSDNVRLILNKAESNVGIEIDQITRLFPQGFSSILPYSKEVSRSINFGLPVLAASPSADVSKKLAEGMASFLPDGPNAVAAASLSADRRSITSRIFRRTPSRPNVTSAAIEMEVATS